MIAYLGLWVLIAMTFNMWALLSVLQSGVALTHKLVWALVLLIPVLGYVAWFLLGPRASAS